MNKEAQAYSDNEYRDIFAASDIGSLASEDFVRYSDSYYKMQADQRGLEYAVKKAEKAGRAEGEAKGRLAALLETARNLLSMNLDVSQISRATGLSEAQILSLL